MTHTIAPPTLEELNERIVVVEDLRAAWYVHPSTPFDIELYCLYAVRDGVATERALLDFFTWAMNEGPFDGCSLDGCDVQDKAENLGLIVSEKYDPTIHGEHSDREEGDDIYVFAPKIMCDPVLSQSPWMDIETAPKDGTEILGVFFRPRDEDFSPVLSGPWTTCFKDGKWRSSWDGEEVLEYMGDLGSEYKSPLYNPSHWMPLPAPPTHNSPPDAALSSQGRGTEET